MNQYPDPIAAELSLHKCPFCGSSAVLSMRDSGGWAALCTSSECFASSTTVYMTNYNAAASAWNRRATETCMNDSSNPYTYKCSECGFIEDTFEYKHCPGCGREVNKAFSCPFCGSKAVRLCSGGPVGSHCMCDTCGATGPIRSDPEEAALIWNEVACRGR